MALMFTCDKPNETMEKKVENYIAFLHLACAVITYRCAGLIG